MRKYRKGPFAPTIGLALAVAAGAPASAQLFGLGPGNTASALSADGTTVAGSTSTGFFRWTVPTGPQPLDIAPGSAIYSLSGNGSVVFGAGAPGGGAFRYDGMTTTFYSHLRAGTMSRDGLVMTGVDPNGSTAVRWTTTDPTPVALSPGSVTQPNAIDADGGVIVGVGANPPPTIQGFRWTQGAGISYIAAPPPYIAAAATAVTADGSIVCGSVGPAFRLGPSGTMEFLPSLPGDSSGEVRAITDDGTTIVGVSELSTRATPVVWSGGSVMALAPFLTSRGVSTAGWTLSSILDISADGSVLAGNGTFNGQDQGWVAVIPAPADSVLLAGGLLAIARRRRNMLRLG